MVGHWVETGPWWQSRGVAPVLGAEGEQRGEQPDEQSAVSVHDLVADREVWRVEAARGSAAVGGGRGVFDLVFDWSQGGWLLTRCAD